MSTAAEMLYLRHVDGRVHFSPSSCISEVTNDAPELCRSNPQLDFGEPPLERLHLLLSETKKKI